LLTVSGFLLAVQAFQDCNGELGITKSTREKIQASRREDMELVRLISTFPGPVVSENMTALMQAGKTIPFEPAIIKQTTDTGIFNETSLVKKTTDGFFDAFIFQNIPGVNFYTARMQEAIRQNYEPYPFAGSRYLVFVRRSR